MTKPYWPSNETQVALVSAWVDYEIPEARDVLTEIYRPVIEHHAKKISRGSFGAPYVDLIAEGCAAFVLAMKSFRSDQGLKFGGYAQVCIRHSMFRLMNASGW